jgi:Outer membrane protein beta-barrel domain
LLPQVSNQKPFHAQDGNTMKTDTRTLGALLLLMVATPAMAQYAGSGWTHSEDTYYQNSLQYHPFRFQVDGGGTITQRASENALNNGWNVGAGITWYPTSLLPLGLRFDGSYNEFSARGALLNQASATYQTRVDEGTIKMWGGDGDVELDFHLGASARLYLFGGVGWYRQQTTYRQYQVQSATFCGWWGCAPGYYGTHAIVERDTTDWHFAKNAGFGLEFGIGQRASFFVDARYMRVNPSSRRFDFLPIRAGLRF